MSGVGAYAFSLATPYCGRILPAEVLVDGGRDRLIRCRQSFEDLSRHQLF
jgi:diaminopimelate decarboxylase